jgi:hypothetical protein
MILGFEESSYVVLPKPGSTTNWRVTSPGVTMTRTFWYGVGTIGQHPTQPGPTGVAKYVRDSRISLAMIESVLLRPHHDFDGFTTDDSKTFTTSTTWNRRLRVVEALDVVKPSKSWCGLKINTTLSHDVTFWDQERLDCLAEDLELTNK